MKKARVLVSAAFAAATVCSAMALCASAENAPDGYVVFYADKAVIGQGLVCEPTKVPFYEGDNGIAIVERAADVIVAEGDYGAYVEGFYDTDTGAEIPAAIAEVCPEMLGRISSDRLCSYDYTAESGWSYYINDESAMVGISDYKPADGDVIQFRFTVYGYGSDLGVDNSSWGGAPALVEAVDTAQLASLAAAADKDTSEYDAAIEVLGKFGATQQEIDAAAEALVVADEGGSEPDYTTADDKGSAETGVESAAAAIGIFGIAAMAAMFSRKR